MWRTNYCHEISHETPIENDLIVMYFEIYRVGYIECLSTRYVVKSQDGKNYERKDDMQAWKRRKVLGHKNLTLFKLLITSLLSSNQVTFLSSSSLV